MPHDNQPHHCENGVWFNADGWSVEYTPPTRPWSLPPEKANRAVGESIIAYLNSVVDSTRIG